MNLAVTRTSSCFIAEIDSNANYGANYREGNAMEKSIPSVASPNKFANKRDEEVYGKQMFNFEAFVLKQLIQNAQ